MDDGALNGIAQCQAKLEAAKLIGKQRQITFQARILARLVTAHPEEAKACGVAQDTSLAAHYLVFTYGCLGDPIVIGSDKKDEVGRQMRLRHGYYNALVAATADQLVAARAVAGTGPAQAAYKERKVEIGDCFKAIRIIHREAGRRVRSPQKDLLRGRIIELKKGLSALARAASAERIQLRQDYALALKQLGTQVKARVKDVRRRYRQLGLWQGNYRQVEKEFNRIYRVALRKGGRLHFRYENRDGSYPQEFHNWAGWDGAGTLSASLSQNWISKEMRSVLQGSNPMFRIEPLTQSNMAHLHIWPSVDLSRKTSRRLHVAKLRIGSLRQQKLQAVWAAVAFVMHREIPEDAEIVEVHLQRRCIASHTRCELRVVLRIASPEILKSGTEAKVAIACERAPAIKGLLATEPPNSRVWVSVISTDSFGSVRKLLRGWTPQGQGVFTDELNRARHQLASNFESQAARLAPVASGTDIIGGLWHMKALLESGAASEQAQKEIWIYSDMMNETAQFNMPALIPTGPEGMLKRAKSSRLLVPLRGYRIHVLGASPAGMNATAWTTLKDFWTLYFREVGAELVLYSAEATNERQ